MAKASKASEESTVKSQSLEGFEQAYYDYIQVFQDEQLKVQNAFEKAYNNYIKALQNGRIKYQKSTTEAYHQYLEEVQDQQPQGNEAYNNYLKKISDAEINIQNLSSEAYLTYLQALENSQQSTNEAAKKAYNDYVNSLKELWTQIDVIQFDSLQLAKISKIMNSVAFYARIYY